MNDDDEWDATVPLLENPPTRPNEGFMRTMLERHGIRARGRVFKAGEMERLLREIGYEIEE